MLQKIHFMEYNQSTQTYKLQDSNNDYEPFFNYMCDRTYVPFSAITVAMRTKSLLKRCRWIFRKLSKKKDPLVVLKVNTWANFLKQIIYNSDISRNKKLNFKLADNI